VKGPQKKIDKGKRDLFAEDTSEAVGAPGRGDARKGRGQRKRGAKKRRQGQVAKNRETMSREAKSETCEMSLLKQDCFGEEKKNLRKEKRTRRAKERCENVVGG